MRYFVILLLSLCMGPFAATVAPAAERAISDAADEVQDMCVARESFQGCCSNKFGILGVTVEGVECLDGTLSPTYKSALTPLNGCCSYNGGFSYAKVSDGIVHCKNGKVSPTCKVEFSACPAT